MTAEHDYNDAMRENGELRDRIDRLRAALEPFAEVARWAERNSHNLEKFDMLLRGPGREIAGHLQAQAPDFMRAKAALDEQLTKGEKG